MQDYSTVKQKFNRLELKVATNSFSSSIKFNSGELWLLDCGPEAKLFWPDIKSGRAPYWNSAIWPKLFRQSITFQVVFGPWCRVNLWPLFCALELDDIKHKYSLSSIERAEHENKHKYLYTVIQCKLNCNKYQLPHLLMFTFCWYCFSYSVIWSFMRMCCSGRYCLKGFPHICSPHNATESDLTQFEWKSRH